jgi:hypothetical protein
LEGAKHAPENTGHVQALIDAVMAFLNKLDGRDGS